MSSELTAIVQYMVQLETCQNWEYAQLHAIAEMGIGTYLAQQLHAEK